MDFLPSGGAGSAARHRGARRRDESPCRPGATGRRARLLRQHRANREAGHLAERTLVFRQPGASAELVPVRGTRFRLEGQENASVEFVVEDGSATGLVIRQAGQVFEGERVE